MLSGASARSPSSRSCRRRSKRSRGAVQGAGLEVAPVPMHVIDVADENLPALGTAVAVTFTVLVRQPCHRHE